MRWGQTLPPALPGADSSVRAPAPAVGAARAWGIVSSTAVVFQLQAARSALPGAQVHRGRTGEQRSPVPHKWGLWQHPSPHACSSPLCLFMHLPFMQGRLLRNQRLLMLKALIRRDKTALKIPHHQPPGCWGWRGAGSLRPGVLLGTSQLCVLQVALSCRPVPRNTGSCCAGTERDWLGPGAWAPAAGASRCQSRLILLQEERGHPGQPRLQGAAAAVWCPPALCLPQGSRGCAAWGRSASSAPPAFRPSSAPPWPPRQVGASCPLLAAASLSPQQMRCP